MTAAEIIRLRADELGYWSATAAQQLAIRKRLNEGAGYSRQAIADALKRASKPGRPKHPRCVTCGQRLPKETAP